MTDNLLPIELHRQMAAEALRGIEFQAGAAARFLEHGADAAAVETYLRIVSIFKEFASPSMKVIATTDDPLTREAAIEWRENTDRRAVAK